MYGQNQFSEPIGFNFGVLQGGTPDTTLTGVGSGIRSHVELCSFSLVSPVLSVHLTPDCSIDLYAGSQMVLFRYSRADLTAN